MGAMVRNEQPGGGGGRGIGSLGRLLERGIQAWIRATGRLVRLEDATWLAGPRGGATIGRGVYETYARAAGLEVRADPAAGLLPDFTCLGGPRFAPERVDPAIRDFYERTAGYTLDAWSQWSGPLRPFAGALILLVSRGIEQLSLPLAPLETSRGMTSEILRLVDPRTGETRYAGWLRTAAGTGRVIYAGFYTTCTPPGAPGPCVKVVFPLPGGSASVLLRPENRPDGSFALVSAGRRFGDAGYYRLHYRDERAARVRYLPIRETIHVYVGDDGALRTDHEFRFRGLRFLALHYKIAPKPPAREMGTAEGPR
jgi:hypothetical protein